MSDQAPELSADDAAYSGQILDGARNIAKYLISLGFSEMTVKKIENRIVANKRSFLRHLNLSQQLRNFK